MNTTRINKSSYWLSSVETRFDCMMFDSYDIGEPELILDINEKLKENSPVFKLSE